MDDRNPYAPSRASLSLTTPVQTADSSSGIAVWRDGNVLITLPGAEMPQRCVKCNEPADRPTKPRKVYWHHPAIYLLLLFNIIIYAIVAVIARRRAFISPGLCEEHKKRRRVALILAWTGFLGGVLLVFGAIGSSLGAWGALLGVLLILAAVLCGLFARVVYAQKIDKEYVRLKGCGNPFLNSLPPFSGLPG